MDTSDILLIICCALVLNIKIIAAESPLPRTEENKSGTKCQTLTIQNELDSYTTMNESYCAYALAFYNGFFSTVLLNNRDMLYLYAYSVPIGNISIKVKGSDISKESRRICSSDKKYSFVYGAGVVPIKKSTSLDTTVTTNVATEGLNTEQDDYSDIFILCCTTCDLVQGDLNHIKKFIKSAYTYQRPYNIQDLNGLITEDENNGNAGVVIKFNLEYMLGEYPATIGYCLNSVYDFEPSYLNNGVCIFTLSKHLETNVSEVQFGSMHVGQDRCEANVNNYEPQYNSTCAIKLSSQSYFVKCCCYGPNPSYCQEQLDPLSSNGIHCAVIPKRAGSNFSNIRTEEKIKTTDIMSTDKERFCVFSLFVSKTTVGTLLEISADYSKPNGVLSCSKYFVKKYWITKQNPTMCFYQNDDAPACPIFDYKGGDHHSIACCCRHNMCNTKGFSILNRHLSNIKGKTSECYYHGTYQHVLTSWLWGHVDVCLVNYVDKEKARSWVLSMGYKGNISSIPAIYNLITDMTTILTDHSLHNLLLEKKQCKYHDVELNKNYLRKMQCGDAFKITNTYLPLKVFACYCNTTKEGKYCDKNLRYTIHKKPKKYSKSYGCIKENLLMGQKPHFEENHESSYCYTSLVLNASGSTYKRGSYGYKKAAEYQIPFNTFAVEMRELSGDILYSNCLIRKTNEGSESFCVCRNDESSYICNHIKKNPYCIQGAYQLNSVYMENRKTFSCDFNKETLRCPTEKCIATMHLTLDEQGNKRVAPRSFCFNIITEERKMKQKNQIIKINRVLMNPDIIYQVCTLFSKYEKCFFYPPSYIWCCYNSSGQIEVMDMLHQYTKNVQS